MCKQAIEKEQSLSKEVPGYLACMKLPDKEFFPAPPKNEGGGG